MHGSKIPIPLDYSIKEAVISICNECWYSPVDRMFIAIIESIFFSGYYPCKLTCPE